VWIPGKFESNARGRISGNNPDERVVPYGEMCRFKDYEGKPGAIRIVPRHLSKKMLDHYSHLRLAAKRQAVEALGAGLIGPGPGVDQTKATGKAN
jgi:hypothetical protein